VFSEILDSKKGQNIGQSVNGEETICELHREIYDLLVLNLAIQNPELLEKIVHILERAYICGVKMDKKMVENKCKFTSWSEHPDKEEAVRLRKLRCYLIMELDRIKRIEEKDEVSTDL
jgi:hypothetical protein